MRLHIWQVNQKAVADNQVCSLRDESLAPRFKSFPQCPPSSSGETQCWEPITRDRLFCKSDISIKTHSCLTQHYRQNKVLIQSIDGFHFHFWSMYEYACVCQGEWVNKTSKRLFNFSQQSLSSSHGRSQTVFFFCYDLHSRVNKVLASTAINF